MAPSTTGDKMPAQICVMGVSAAGKSTVGTLLARKLDAKFIDADDLHPDVNRAKMAAGRPLTDDDRWSWLDSVGHALAEADSAGRTTVIACSALARRYRERIRDTARHVVFVHLHGADAILVRRAAGRQDHFMPAALLRSQLDTLELLTADEAGITIDIDATPEALVDTIVDTLVRLPSRVGD
jgi:gluconokinase